MLKKLNLGCGENYKEGWINVDFNKGVRADVYADLTKKLPFEDNSIDEILLDNVLEHIKREKYIWFIDELYKICKKGAMIKIYVPHYSSTCAFKHLTHYNFFGIGSFGIYKPKSRAGERYGNGKTRFKITEKFLLGAHNSANYQFLTNISKVFNKFFNLGGERWKLLIEKLNVFGFEEIYYELKVIK